MRPEFKNLKIDLAFPDEKLSAKLLYEYEKADRYVTYLEWSGLPKGASGHESFYELLFNVGFVALNQRYWLRAIDRLELLLELSDGEFNAAETHYHCGLAYLWWAPGLEGRPRQESYKKSQNHFQKALEKDPQHWSACYNLAFVQYDLRMYQLARKNNEKALEILPNYAPAKYNLALCYIALGEFQMAMKKLKGIKASDEGVEDVAKTYISDEDSDEELKPLLRDETFGAEAKSFLQSLKT